MRCIWSNAPQLLSERERERERETDAQMGKKGVGSVTTKFILVTHQLPVSFHGRLRWFHKVLKVRLVVSMCVNGQNFEVCQFKWNLEGNTNFTKMKPIRKFTDWDAKLLSFHSVTWHKQLNQPKAWELIIIMLYSKQLQPPCSVDKNKIIEYQDA